MPSPAVFAHRGAWGTAPQNSLDAVVAAIACGADGVELDVRATADGELVLVHDAESAGVAVARCSYAELSERAGAPPARLAEVVALAAGQIALDVEIKAPGYVGAVLAALARHPPPGLLVTSFDPGVVAQCAGRVRTGLIVGAEAASPEAVARAVSGCGADVRVLEHGLLDRGWLDAGPLAGGPAWVWTVNDDADVDRCLAHPGVETVITDRPARVLARRHAYGLRSGQHRLAGGELRAQRRAQDGGRLADGTPPRVT